MGRTGGTGNTGPTGPAKKTAILQLGGQWRGLSCVEAPNTLFFDLAELAIPVGQAEGQAAIDPLFVEACQPDSIRVLSAQPDVPLAGTLGACVEQGQVVVRAPTTAARPVSVNVLLAGVRRNVTERFPVYTEEQALQNDAFWRQAVAADAAVPAASG